ncbi:hypothetical protein [Dyadobacter sp. Leaf189]|uniref:hypothetical protein n=1 Tax=Dyadobacter sp. Leaf189 TaxID=1736295 RepID=UPI0006F992A1|nr:hypothetical protein [Dyadobacter sp. Leaf189]KQS33923.1 hypothetical protein ASG33_07770 [Dyadobacter sp. Leaf189]
MKQLHYTLIICFLFLAPINRTYAQGNSVNTEPTEVSDESSEMLEKGSFIATLNGSASAANDFQSLTRTWSITPQIGYLIADRLVVGLQFSMGKRYQKVKSGKSVTIVIPEYQLHSALPEIYLRYYIARFRLKPFVQLASGYNLQWGKEFTDGVHNTVSSQNPTLSGAFGLNLRLSRRIGLEALYNTRFDNKSQIIDANEGLTYRLGVSVSLH